MFFCARRPEMVPEALGERLSPSDNTLLQTLSVLGSRLFNQEEGEPGNTKSINLCDKQSSRRPTPKDLSSSSSTSSGVLEEVALSHSFSELSSVQGMEEGARPLDDK